MAAWMGRAGKKWKSLPDRGKSTDVRGRLTHYIHLVEKGKKNECIAVNTKSLISSGLLVNTLLKQSSQHAHIMICQRSSELSEWKKAENKRLCHNKTEGAEQGDSEEQRVFAAERSLFPSSWMKGSNAKCPWSLFPDRWAWKPCYQERKPAPLRPWKQRWKGRFAPWISQSLSKSVNSLPGSGRVRFPFFKQISNLLFSRLKGTSSILWLSVSRIDVIIDGPTGEELKATL
jgi:hypothetical protein